MPTIGRRQRRRLQQGVSQELLGIQRHILLIEDTLQLGRVNRTRIELSHATP